MKRRFHIPIALLLLAFPVFALISVITDGFLGDYEQLAKMAERAEASVVEANVSSGLSACVARAKHAAATALAFIAAKGPTDAALAELSRREPYVRNAFRWVQGRGVVFPQERGATQEERRFLARYVTLFDEGFKDAKRTFTWRSWFEGDRLSFVGWCKAADGSVVGVELETVAFLAEFPSILAGAAGDGFVVEVRDGADGALFKTGETPDRKPDFVSELSSQLPHRTLALWRTGPPAAVQGVGGPIAALVIIVLLFVSASAAGATILVLDARRERRESEKKTSFVSNVSHELKTPLTSIRLCAEMLSEGRAKDDAAKERYLGVITKESERLTRLVDNVLDFGRLEQNRRKYDLADVDLRGVVRDAAESQRSRVEAAGMELSVEVAAEAAIRRVDRDAVSQIVVNLVDNAVKYAAEGKRLDVGVDSNGTVTVADRGPGVPKRDRERVFERFYRCDDSLAAKSSGSGLGLSIARRLAEGMGGSLVCCEREGGGAEFKLEFGGAR